MEQKIAYKILAQKVIAVAVVNYKTELEIFDWTCYIDAVPGINHLMEYEKVATHGHKQSEKIGQVLFPLLDISKYRN